MKQPAIPKKKKLITHFSITYKNGDTVEMTCVRYFVGLYIVVYVNGTLAYQGGCQTLETANKKARAAFKDAEEKGAKVEFTEDEVYPPGVWSPEELAEQQKREHGQEEANTPQPAETTQAAAGDQAS